MNTTKNKKETLNTLMEQFEHPYPLWTLVRPNELRELIDLLRAACDCKEPEQLEQAFESVSNWLQQHPLYVAWILTENLTDYFEAHPDLWKACLNELNAHLEIKKQIRFFSMRELNDFFQGTSPIEIVEFMVNSVDAYCGRFDLNRKYFYRDHDDLVSTDALDWTLFLNTETLEIIREHWKQMPVILAYPFLSKRFQQLDTLHN